MSFLGAAIVTPTGAALPENNEASAQLIPLQMAERLLELS